EDLKRAMKARDEISKETLRMVKADLMHKEIQLGRPLEDAEAIAVLTSAVKTRLDAIAQYEEGGRAELAEHERAQIAVIRRYLPEALSEADARAALAELAKELGVSSRKEMGKLMKAAMDKFRGRLDGKLASKLAGEILG
ncbi:MAG: GatB/YqeY domain-containing protein, partial [Sandaracinaceae bacterium]|nr:GatB/YqeY domain-containing protein [Sandaracinaceae bacterium]